MTAIVYTLCIVSLSNFYKELTVTRDLVRVEL